MSGIQNAEDRFFKIQFNLLKQAMTSNGSTVEPH